MKSEQTQTLKTRICFCSNVFKELKSKTSKINNYRKRSQESPMFRLRRSDFSFERTNGDPDMMVLEKSISKIRVYIALSPLLFDMFFLKNKK